MKNVQRLYTRDQIHDFVLKNWKTELFRDLHARQLKLANDKWEPIEDGYVYQIVENFAKLPRFVFDMSDDRLERAHFSTWWGGIPNRQYDNPYIHDLYWIHEMAHAGNMVFVPDMNLENFERKMTDNELHASVVSEVQVYFEIPELRKLSFPHEIYADRFLKDANFDVRYWMDRTLGLEEMKVRRRDTMMNANPTNKADFWIHRFYTQNAAWVGCWAHSYNKIETEMANLRMNVLSMRRTSVDSVVDKVREMMLDKFLDDFLAKNTQNEIPFLREAEAFAGVYWGNRGHYEDAMK